MVSFTHNRNYHLLTQPATIRLPQNHSRGRRRIFGTASSRDRCSWQSTVADTLLPALVILQEITSRDRSS
jgi:hypothetical protein